MKLINKLLGDKGGGDENKPAFGLTDVGKERGANEDFFRVVPEKSLYIVADGMGGHNAGEVASRNATQMVDAYFTLDLLASVRGNNQKTKEILLQSLMNAHKEVLTMANKHRAYEGMGCTIVVAYIHGISLHVGHVGDARAYVCDPLGIKLLTRDHSYVMELVKKGKMTFEEARLSPLKNRLNQAIGASVDIKPDYNRYTLKEGDRILLCSDGLWDMLTDEQIHQTIMANQPAKEICKNLIDTANNAGGHDNITALVIFYKKEMPRMNLEDSGEFVDRTGEYSFVFDGEK